MDAEEMEGHGERGLTNLYRFSEDLEIMNYAVISQEWSLLQVVRFTNDVIWQKSWIRAMNGYPVEQGIKRRHLSR